MSVDRHSPRTTKDTPHELPSQEVQARLARDGANTLPQRRPTPWWRRVVTQLRDPLVLVLLAAIGSPSDAAADLAGDAGTTISAVRVNAIPAPAGI